MNTGEIIHVAIPQFYTAIELLERPELEGLPLVICSEGESARCSVLAADESAQAAGVRTGQLVSLAKKVCPHMALITPRFDRYQRRADEIKVIISHYGSDIEQFGLDAYWIRPKGDAVQAAKAIISKIREKTGLDATAGIAYNRSLAFLAGKLCRGGDVVFVTPENFRELIWPMPIDSLLFVGLYTAEKLAHINIRTIGELARTDVKVLERLLGQPGRTLWNEANGQGSTVTGARRHTPESISNSWNLPKNATSFGEIVGAFTWLSENVADRAAAEGYLGKTLQISITDLTHVRKYRDMPLDRPTRDAATLLKGAMYLFREYFNVNIPICAVGLSLQKLMPEIAPDQLSFDKLG
jgi:DNA polymerase-4